MSHRFPVVSSVAMLLLAVLSLSACGAALAQAAAGPGVDLNAADAATLARELHAIVEHRRRHGPFRSVDELALVRGIGPKTVERNRARLRIGGGVPAGTTEVTVSRPSARTSSRRQDEGPIIIEGLPRDDG
jgi:competence protein ComEA